MSGSITKIVISAALLLIIFVTGFLLHKWGKPHNNLVFTIHKLATIVLIILMVVMAVSYAKNFGMAGWVLVLAFAVAIAALGLLASGGFMSLDKNHDMMLIIHRIASLVFAAGTGVLLYMFARG
ncbi:MAG: hypothetical protein ACOC12_05610 [Bacteroidota bacterium]